jgi:hypothetical protein
MHAAVCHLGMARWLHTVQTQFHFQLFLNRYESKCH